MDTLPYSAYTTIKVNHPSTSPFQMKVTKFFVKNNINVDIN